MAVLTENPYLLDRIFVTKEYNSQGMYILKLCVNGEWQTVVIDDRLPCTPDGRIIFAKVIC